MKMQKGMTVHKTMMLAALLAAVAPANAETIAIKAGRVITDAAAAPRGASTIIVENGRITAINDASVPIPAGATIIDQSARTLLPGLIDTHVHLTGNPGTPFWNEAIVAGKAADIIAVDGDPLTDAGELARVNWAMARGKVVD